MPFFMVDDQFHNHAKVQRLLDRGRDGLEAIGLWTLAGSLSQAQLSDGVLTESTCARLIGDKARVRKLAKLLVDVGLWEHTKDDGQPAHAFHDWIDVHKRTGAAVKNERRRRAELKDPEVIRAVRARDGDTCRYCGKTVKWGDQRSDHGGTYDHVDPHLVVGASNVVVACRACNRKKASRAPEEASMQLRPPPQVPPIPPLATRGRANGSDNIGSGDSARNESGTESDSDNLTPRARDAGAREGARAGQGQGQGRAGLPPQDRLVPTDFLGGIGSPWANYHGRPPDVEQPQCPEHGMDLPCRSCARAVAVEGSA